MAQLSEEDASREVHKVLSTEFTCYRRHTLVLTNYSLYRIPEALWKISFLQQLDLSDNKLTKLPPEIGKMAALRSLKLKRNELTTLPNTIGSLTALHMLDLSFNALTNLPSSFAKLSRLQYLHLNDNRLTSLPTEVLKLPLQYMFICTTANNNFDSTITEPTTRFFVPSLLSIAMTKVVANHSIQDISRSTFIPTDLKERFSQDLQACELCGHSYYGSPMGEKLYPTTIQNQTVILSTRRCGAACTGTW